MNTTSCNPNEADGQLALRDRAPLSQLNLCQGNRPFDYSQLSDGDLVTGSQRGDQYAFVELCKRHSSMVKRKIRRIVRNHEDTEDAFQDTLLRAYTHLDSFRGSCKFSSWFTTIGVNSALMIMRKRKARRETHELVTLPDTGRAEVREHVDQSAGPEGIYLKQLFILLVRREVQKLQPSLRSIVERHYGSEDSLEESAKSLDISLSAAKSRLLRGRRRLRFSLAKHGISEFGT